MIWVPDPPHTMVGFSVKHMMISTLRGNFDRYGGTLDVNLEHPEQSVIEGWVDVASIDTGSDMRDGHLRSPDFFDAETHPRMTFRSTSIEPLGDNQYKVTGDLTIKGITRPLVLEANFEGRVIDTFGVDRMGFSAEGRMRRSDWGLNWNMALEAGGFAVSEQVKILIEMEVIQQQQIPAAEAEAEAESQMKAI